LDYRNRKISVHTLALPELIEKLTDGSFLIPAFQRLFVWSPGSIIDLWNSVYRCYPIGTLLFWNTPVRLHADREVGGFYIPGNENGDDPLRSYILDGQQRATSLQVSFLGGKKRIRENCDFDFTLYFDLKDGSFFFEKDYYRHRRDVDGALILRLSEVPMLPDDYGAHLEDFTPDVGNRLRQLQYMFTGYHIPLIRLEGFDVSSVCAVFERINQTGIRLGLTDILIARGFRDSAIIVEEDFPVR
jgi:uncharacterized protein with ParB-like and HNH nuclease domain